MTPEVFSGEIKVKLEGDKVKDHTVDIEELGKFLLNFQGLMVSYSPDRNAKALSQLYLKEIRTGSVELVFQGIQQQNLTELKNVVEDSYNKVLSSVRLINVDPDTARGEIVKDFSDVSNRLKVETRLKAILSSKLVIGLEGPNNEVLKFSPIGKEIVDKWITEDYRIGTRSRKGVIMRIKGDPPEKYFTMITDTGESIRCFYGDEHEHQVIDYFKKQPISVTGLVGKKVRSSEIREILEIKQWDRVKLDQLGNFVFRESIEITVSFEDDVWCLQSSELNTTGCGNSYEEALKDFKDTFGQVYKLYVVDYKNTELEHNAESFRKRLIEILERRELDETS
jgi:hypothetical protein